MVSDKQHYARNEMIHTPFPSFHLESNFSIAAGGMLFPFAAYYVFRTHELIARYSIYSNTSRWKEANQSREKEFPPVPCSKCKTEAHTETHTKTHTDTTKTHTQAKNNLQQVRTAKARNPLIYKALRSLSSTK